MLYGATNTKGLYTVPNGSGTQFTDGCNAIWDLGLRDLKFYATADFASDYPLQTTFGSTPTNITEFLQTAPVAAQLSRAWNSVVMTMLTFANGTTNWWRVAPTPAKFLAEYNELKAAAVHLLTTYNNSGIVFVAQNWEGDWSFGDTTDVNLLIDRKYVDYYAAFLATRQRAISDARAETPHRNVTILNAFEANRVLDAKDSPHRRRILTDISRRLQPDLVSYSCYDSPFKNGWDSNFAAWEATCQTEMTRAIRLLKLAFPGKPIQIGEAGVPENEATNDHPTYDVGAMIDRMRDIALAGGCNRFLYWQVFDNEPHGTYTYRGYWLRKPNNDLTLAGARMQAYAAGG